MRALTWIALVLSGLVLPGCNAGVGGILLAVFLQDDDHHGRKAREAALAAAELVDLENERTRPDDTIILLRLRNAEEEPADLFVELSAGGEPFRSITLRPLFPQLSTGPGRLTGLATSSAGVVHRIGWHALRDLGTDELRTVTLRFTGDLVEPLEAVVVIGNDAPAILEVGTTQPEGGDVRVFVALTDSSSDPSDVLLEFAVGPEVEGGDEGSPPRFEPATVVGDAIGLETSPSGVAHAFGWAAVQDAGPFDRPARIRLTPIDRIEGEVGKTGASVEREIVLDSNARPRVEILAEEVLAGEDQRRGIALRFIVRDGESDPVDAVVQWAPDGGPFPELDAALDRDPAARAALLANPQARRPLQVATLAVEMLEGTVEEPAAGALGSDSVLASWLRAEGELRGLAAGALAGRRLELLQPGSEAPEAQHRVACAYSAADGVLRADRPFDPPAAPGALLRIALGGSEGSLRLASSPEGVAHRLAWDAQADLPGGGPVRFRITPFDRAAGDGSECVAYGPSPGAAPGDRGVASDLGGVKRLRGPFPEGDAWAVPIAAIDVPAALAAGDLNGDGRVDLACAARGSDSVVLLFQSTPGVFDTLRLADSGLAGAASLVVRDLDSDGDLDLAACGEESGKVLVIRQLPGFDFFADRSALTAGGTLVRPAALAAEDLDSDGDAELAVIEAGGADRGVVVFFGESGARGAGCGAAEGGYRACVLRDPAQG
ncbi:MAG: VCBS repeat-containing protein, partial [Planctomycetes bacterium]|nr:VCBS repeat-containing protein [Planctomycetota bacterium]